MKKALLLMTALLGWGFLSAQTQPENSDDRVACYRMMSGVRKVISIPDIDGYKTLKCDFHTHTVFCDGMDSPEELVRRTGRDGDD